MTGRSGGGPAHYEIRVRGPIGPTILEAFPMLSVHLASKDTFLSGPLDQSALYGVIHQLESLGLELLEIRCPGTDGVN